MNTRNRPPPIAWRKSGSDARRRSSRPERSEGLWDELDSLSMAFHLAGGANTAGGAGASGGAVQAALPCRRHQKKEAIANSFVTINQQNCDNIFLAQRIS